MQKWFQLTVLIIMLHVFERKAAYRSAEKRLKQKLLPKHTLTVKLQKEHLRTASLKELDRLKVLDSDLYLTTECSSLLLLLSFKDSILHLCSCFHVRSTSIVGMMWSSSCSVNNEEKVQFRHEGRALSQLLLKVPCQSGSSQHFWMHE